jgi:hypothetical protein
MKTTLLALTLLTFVTPYRALAQPTAAKTPSTIVAGKVVWGSKIPEEQRKLNSTAAMYIFAKRGEGGPPVAVKRIAQPISIPYTFTLTTDDVMIAGSETKGSMKVIARISQSGAAMPVSKGDIEGATSKPVLSGAKDIELQLNTVK